MKKTDTKKQAVSGLQTVNSESRTTPAILMISLFIICVISAWLAYGPTLVVVPQIYRPLPTGQIEGAPAIGNARFTLRDDSGRVVTEKTLKNGYYHLIFFGFASCPDMCPGMLQLMAGVEEKLPEGVKERLQFVFVSVDPERDSLEKLGAYVRDFSPRFVGWTGEKAEIDAMVKGYLAYYAKRPASAGTAKDDYNVDHSGFAYLMGPDGAYLSHFRSSDSATSLQQGLETLVKPGVQPRSGR